MPKRVSTLFALSLLVTFGFAKDKTKTTLPAYVLQAQTVAIIVDPNASFSTDDPQANLSAQRDVEAALLKWGRFKPVSEAQTADLIVAVRKGNGHLMDEMVSDAQQNRSGNNSGDRGGSIDPQRGSQPNQPGLGPSQQTHRSPTEFGDNEDSFAVFKGGDNPRYATPVWRYVTGDALNPQTVPAVAAFKKAVAAAEKAQKP
jgi:hypothetical protein